MSGTKKFQNKDLLLCLAGLYIINHDVIGDRQKKEVKILWWRTLKIWMKNCMHFMLFICLFIYSLIHSSINIYGNLVGHILSF